MTKAFCFKHVLSFNTPSGTSRGVLNQKTSWFIVVKNEKKIGIGECSLIEGLSPDPMESYEETLNYTCENIHLGFDVLSKKLESYPSILFGLESAFLSLNSISPFSIFPSDFTKHKDNIPINGLVWMGDKAFMRSQVIEKINSGFDCIKIKIGAIDFNTELELLKNIRREFSEKDIEIRVDANGAFNYEEALKNLSLLNKLKIHSIEQPIMPNQWEKMSLLCEKSPIDIALDEELINVFSLKQKEMILSIKPKYIILKPSLIGGLKKAEDWIDLAEKNDIKWWATSALESNVGLSIIAQWVYRKSSSMKQGLGTGKLYSNNIASPHYIKKGCLYHNPKIKWNMNFFKEFV